MAKHPLSYTRNGAALGPEISMKDVWRMRKTGNSVLPKGDSLTHEPEAATEKATEFASQFSLQGMKTKHSRSPCSPLHKYKPRTVSSTAIGWHHETEWGPKP